MAEDFRRDATDGLTFGEMHDRDVDNLKLVTTSKRCKEYSFNNLNVALKWTNDAMQGIYMKFGIDKDKIIHTALSLPIDSFLCRQVMAENPMLKGKIDPRKLLAAKQLDVKMKEADLHNEDRQYNGKDKWRTGHYYYHHNEIAYFISAPYRRKGGFYQTPHVIVPAFGKWFIQSNYKPDQVKVVAA